MHSSSDEFRAKMANEKLPQRVIDTFAYYYARLIKGESGMVPEEEIDPISSTEIISADSLGHYTSAGEQALRHAACIKLNGGLGTSMGLSGPKSLLPVKDGLSFLDIAVRQIRVLNERSGSHVPLILMNSFSTHDETTAHLRDTLGANAEFPLTFLQNKYPKVLRDTFAPVSRPRETELEWNPPGHGDVYTALVTSGLLTRLLSRDVRYAFISNIDNLGATMDLSLLGYFAGESLPFVMEVVRRTEMDRKGGHIARRSTDGRLVLREIAQTPTGDLDQFQDIKRHGYFNSNNIWVDLSRLKNLLDHSTDGILPLPLIANAKTVDPRDKASPKVFQIETAMGSAISLFDNAQAVLVTEHRFRPVKKCDDLVALRSDCFTLSEDALLEPAPHRELPRITIALDSAFYGKYDQLTKRFPHGVPSLVDCASLTVTGDIVFGREVTITGHTDIRGMAGSQAYVPDGATLEGNVVL